MKLEMQKRYPIQLGDIRSAHLYLVGCGGTGSFLALHLARLAYQAPGQHLEIHLTFIDHDRIEDTNIGRQNFCPAEIGENKAYTLARRMSLAFGLKITALCEPFNPGDIDHFGFRRDGAVAILLGCVDQPAARREMASAVEQSGRASSLWWLDGGNHEHAGQVHLGNHHSITISPLGFCTHLPHPAVQAPDLLLDRQVNATTVPSCAELAAANIQSLMINQAVAGWMATYIARLLISRDLDIMATYINLAAGSARSVGITKPVEAEE